ncbi:MAG: oxygen-dependent coproporphyrinogen oxidase [Bacteroidetes bacterium]|nr:oxygen-dependent coproporphyrinogen oxidase [Bacteroidota bacterium]
MPTNALPPNRDTIADAFRTLQDQICEGLEQFDEKGLFRQDLWRRDAGGGGRTRLIENANILEKGGVNFSAVHGPMPEKIAAALNLSAGEFFATGVSIVLHPFNPWVPIIHMNVRYFEMSNGTWWFGGGIDLTPHYVVPEDAVFFHQSLKNVCDHHDPEYFGRFKTWADDYFYIRHRQETRGIGGIFFDRLDGANHQTREQRFAFVLEVGQNFVPIYTELMRRHKDRSYGNLEKSWQEHRRGRYVEFNLVYDKGTKFGLDTDGRAESILMSLPPLARWTYDHKPEQDPEALRTQSLLVKGIDWAAGAPAVSA